MNLKVYLALKDMKIKEFGEIIGYNKAYISQLINGRKTPSKRLATLIEKITQGHVTSADFQLKVLQEKKADTSQEVKIKIV
ncbi:MAG TPA: helix-turn-helix transcriptional regulator [Saprospiraceae bacterium]|nr:helix-turn-helix transcriptional regulator [Saprospiraceae bacterium]